MSGIGRFWMKVRVAPSDACWEWLAYRNPGGYGVFGAGQGRVFQGALAHRFAYELHEGPIPDGLSIDHLCRNTWCVNPRHLEAVDIGTNIRRGGNSLRTHCPAGHPYDEANTYAVPGKRRCRTCNRERVRRAYYERKQQLSEALS